MVGSALDRRRPTSGTRSVKAEPQLKVVNNLNWLAVLFYILLHFGCLAAFYTGINCQAVALFCAAFLLRAFGVSIVYHRYFAHRSFQTSRLMQFSLAVYGALTVLGGPLWWAQTHREHHRNADTPEDIHSPHYQGFIYSHCGWFLDNRHRSVDRTKIGDLAKFPELVFVDRMDLVFKVIYAAGCYWLFGIVGVVWGFLLPTVIVLQMIHWIQSVSHSIGGYRRYPTLDDSRNHWLFGIISLGEGFHHNHHCFPNSARLGLRWWEFDAGYWTLVALSWLGLIWDLKVPVQEVRGRRDERAERAVVYAKAKVRKLGDRLDAALSTLERETSDCEPLRIACRELRARAAGHIDAFAGRIRDLLVAGPFTFQGAFDELRQILSQDARFTLAAAADNMHFTMHRIDEMLYDMPATLRRVRAAKPAWR